MRELEQHNAVITGTMLGIEDHGTMSFMLYLEFDGGGVGFGGYSLDEYDEDKGERVGVGISIDLIKDILETVGVEKWEDLKGKHIVVESEGWGGQAKGIRNFIKQDKWLRPKEWFEAHGVV